ncbi:MarR family winged helix-turn-helix transcriptional regulator [Leifsonia sp. NPDC058230]|uniref:MarR family winged helix-turn-helix transcriptional regulator n=1 Tax=Leifsonia sp. NPDC058230 TaxID=3346391 RepID=UPI0036D93B17
MSDSPADADAGTRSVLDALRAYRAAEAAMRRRRGVAMNITENDFLALRYILANDDAGRVTNAKDIAHYLGISSASTTTLIGRLVRDGYVQKRASTTDRRSIEIVPLRLSEPPIREAVGDTHELVIQAAASLSPEERLTVAGFLKRLQSAVDGIDQQGDGHATRE